MSSPKLDWELIASIPKGVRNQAIHVSGDVFVPKYFDVHASLQHVREDEPLDVGFWVELGCQTFNGRDAYANEVKVVAPVQVLPGDPLGRGVTGGLLRNIPVKRLANWGLRLIAMERSEAGEWHRVMPETERGRFTLKSTTAAGVTERPGLNLWAIDADIKATLEETFGAAKTQKVGRRPTRDEKFWDEIAAAYCGAVENHEPTIDAVQKLLGPYYSRGYVKNLITEARKRGYDLPKRGRVK
jgi:hypothetical protein